MCPRHSFGKAISAIHHGDNSSWLPQGDIHVLNQNEVLGGLWEGEGYTSRD